MGGRYHLEQMAEPIQYAAAEGDIRLLLVDTCGSEATLALAQGESVVAQRGLPGRSASEGLIEAIGELLREQGWRLRELDALVVVRGPGSFTGVRVGLSVAKAMAEACSLPLIAMSRLEVLAGDDVSAAVVALLAGRKEVFWAYRAQGEVVEQGVALPGWVAEYANLRGLPVRCERGEESSFAGAEVLEVEPLTAATALPLARRRMAQGVFDDPLLLDALYLHKTEQETLERQRKHRAERVSGARP